MGVVVMPVTSCLVDFYLFDIPVQVPSVVKQ